MTKVLVVDDATTVRLFMKTIYRSAGVEVAEARDGQEGLEMALSGLSDLAFVDINMPVLDGYEFVRRLREQECGRTLPVVMCSTESKIEDETRAYEAGANYYVRKPVPKELVLQLGRILGGGQ